MDHKCCSKCGTDKPLSEFNRYARSKDGHQPYCRACAAEYFTNRRDEIMVLIRTRKQERTLENTLHVREYLIGHPCVDCGESDPVVLEFDHVRGVKSGHISTMARTPVSLRKLQAEMAKCDVRCANCHRRKSAERGGWWRNLGFPDPQGAAGVTDSVVAF
jgi:hypothetical protein